MRCGEGAIIVVHARVGITPGDGHAWREGQRAGWVVAGGNWRRTGVFFGYKCSLLAWARHPQPDLEP